MMGFRLTPEEGDSIKLSAWQWRPILEVIGQAGVLDEDTVVLMGSNGGLPITAAQAELIADAIDAVAATVPDGSRLTLDGGTVDGPDDGTFYRDDLSLNYSTPKTSLLAFAAFCRSSGGFSVG
jgi:hypothetical protein